jgi:hypothetical protein
MAKSARISGSGPRNVDRPAKKKIEIEKFVSPRPRPLLGPLNFMERPGNVDRPKKK